MSNQQVVEELSLIARLFAFISFLKFSIFGVYLLICDLDPIGTLKRKLWMSSRTPPHGLKLDKSHKSLELILDETLVEFHQQQQQNSKKNKSDSSDRAEEQRYAIVTGANSGIGYETVKVLALNGYHVIMACRSLQRANEAKKKLEEEFQAKASCSPLLHSMIGKLVVMQCDLGDLNSVKTFATDVIRSQYRVNLLINNAGVMIPPFELTKQGYETQFGSNFLAHFLLTHLLLDVLHKNGPSRILNVSSAAHWTGVINWKNISPKTIHEYDPCIGYTQSKVCQIMSTYKMHRYLKEKKMSNNVTVNVLHPGIISTNINTNLARWATFLQDLLVKSYSLTPSQGAVNTLYLALSPEVQEVSGKYFSYCMPALSNPVSYDVEQQEKLWRVAMDMIHEFL